MLMKPLLRTLIFTLFLSNLLEAGKLFGQRRLEEGDHSSLLSLPFVPIEEVFNPSIISGFNDWYSVYVPRHLWNKNTEPARQQGIEMKGSIDNHISQLKEHMTNLQKEKELIDRFPPMFLDVKISRVNGEVNKYINKDVPNPFVQPQVQEALADSHGPHIPDLINHYNSFSVNSELVKWVAKSYRIDWDEKSTDLQEPLTAKINDLAEPLRKTLRTILKIHTQPSAEEYSDIRADDKPTLQSFWDGFKFLLGDQTTLNDLIRDSLIQTGKAPVPEQSFFTPDFFQVLRSLPSDFRPELSREEFLTLDGPKDTLEDIRPLAQPLFFSSDFPKEFTADPRYLNPAEQPDLNVDPVELAVAKKNAELHKILYIVYLLARLDNTIPADKPLDNQEILKTLKDWVIKTKAFDDQPKAPEPTDIEELISKPSEQPSADTKVRPEQMHALLEAPVFKKHFLELVTLICSKIVGCEMKKEAENPELLDKVADFGNFDDIRGDKPNPFVPKEIADEVKENLAKRNVETLMFELDEQLDDMLDDTPEFDDNQLDQMDGERFSDKTLGPIDVTPLDQLPTDIKTPGKKRIERKPKEKEPKIREDKSGKVTPFRPQEEELDEQGNKIVKSPSDIVLPSEDEIEPVTPSEDDLPDVLKIPTFKQVEERRRKYQGKTADKKDDKIEEILNRFIPKEGELDEQGRKFIEKLDDKAAASEPAKAAHLKNIIIQFLIRRTEEAGDKPDKKVEDITKLVNTKEVDRLLRPLSAASTAGLRNFFMMTVINEKGLKYTPFSPLEKKFFDTDLLFFVGMHNWENMIQIRENRRMSPAEKKEAAIPLTREIIIAMTHLNGGAFTGKQGEEATKKLLSEKNKVLSKNTVLLHRMPAYHLFVSFLDFFDYFKVDQQANAVYGGYRQVYVNFYSFLVSLRKTIPFEITHPHQYVLAQLEHCLQYTASIERVDDKNANAICMLSHRKYAEMYYFYKVYMLATNKPGVSDLAPPAGFTFDTNVNIFLNFATQVISYQTVLNNQCTPDNAFPICRAWTFFNALVSYLQLSQVAIDIDSLRPVFATPEFGSDSYLFTVLNAVDATILNVERGNMKDFSKYNLLKEALQALGIRFDSFDEQHIRSLSEYLKRSYKRIFFEDDEVIANRLVAAILAGEESPDSNLDSLKQVISVDNSYMPENLAFFLQLATTDQQFARIAKLVIDTNAGSNLLNLRNPDNFAVYKNLVDNVANLRITSDSQPEALNKARLDMIRNFMHDRVRKFSSLCLNIIRNEFHNQALEVEEFDMAEFLMEEFEGEKKTIEDRADEQWSSVGQEISQTVQSQPQLFTTEQVISLEVPEDEAETYKALFSLNKPNVIDFGVIAKMDEGLMNKDFTLNGQILKPEEKKFAEAQLVTIKNKILLQMEEKKKESESSSPKKEMKMI